MLRMLNRFICARLFSTPWIVTHQVPLSMGFSRQEYWSGLPCPSPGDLPNAGTEPTFLVPPALAGGFFITSATWTINGRKWPFIQPVNKCVYGKDIVQRPAQKIFLARKHICKYQSMKHTSQHLVHILQNLLPIYPAKHTLPYSPLAPKFLPLKHIEMDNKITVQCLTLEGFAFSITLK